jgi:hypothetical protein
MRSTKAFVAQLVDLALLTILLARRNGLSAEREAELVAALSLGIDLGFGQPMEHVLRQCLISLHLAERLQLANEEKVVVYYTALLLTVGCHSDAHEQAKWFGDDFALKANKYKYEMRDPRGAAATIGLIGGRGNPPLHRFRVGLEFAISGRRPRRHDFASCGAGADVGRAARSGR